MLFVYKPSQGCVKRLRKKKSDLLLLAIGSAAIYHSSLGFTSNAL